MATTLNDVKLVLTELLDNHGDAFKKLACGPTYKTLLTKSRAAIEALPPALLDNRPLAEQMAEADEEHDGYGGALWHLTESYLRLPSATPAQREAAARIRQAFVPEMQELKGSYADEAARAAERRPKLKELTADLGALPVAGTKGASLGDWAESFLDAGDRLAGLLGQRASHTAEQGKDGDRRAAAQLRTATMGQLNRFRSAVRDEVDTNEKLPRHLEAQLFSHFDQLTAQRAEAAARQVSKDGESGKKSNGNAANAKDAGAISDEAPTKPKLG